MQSYALVLFGGMLVGIAAAILLLFNGQIAGISGIVGNLNTKQAWQVPWRFFFVVGLVVGGLLTKLVWPTAFGDTSAGTWGIVAAGLLVGAGTRLGNGCTSGHGVCGMSRLSPRSIVATMTFISAGVITVALTRLLGGSL